jgi:hypothetical protein
VAAGAVVGAAPEPHPARIVASMPIRTSVIVRDLCIAVFLSC